MKNPIRNIKRILLSALTLTLSFTAAPLAEEEDVILGYADSDTAYSAATVSITRAQALTLARETGFNDVQIVEHVTQEESKFDRVADQVPKEGERVLEDTQITLAIYVSPGEAPQESPAAENDNTN